MVILLKDRSMKKITLVISCLICSFILLGQDKKKYPLDFGDVFVLQVTLKKEVLKSKCPCQKSRKCTLNEMIVTKVFYCPSNLSFDSSELLNLKYIAINSMDKNKLQKDSILFITAKPSGSKYYLSFTNVLNIDSIKDYDFYHPYSYLSELKPCKRKDAFERYITNQ